MIPNVTVTSRVGLILFMIQADRVILEVVLTLFMTIKITVTLSKLNKSMTPKEHGDLRNRLDLVYDIMLIVTFKVNST